MPDLLDAVQARVDDFREDAIRQALAAGTPAAAESATHCAECGEEIPEARRQAVPGVSTCIECRSKMERRRRDI